ncbi:carbohydrate porin [uncultured Bacteroides sp.]|uniref:carbohydrate porin n=1 Tax=uncultured Bacteroides sp. TaxID=162156 RepID=UPI002AA8DA73|nr:carbohydrate porin [uncultured Bacteroides sp.]
MGKAIFFVALAFNFYFISAYAQDSSPKEEQRVLTVEVSYIGDNINNLSGGIKSGSRYLGMANLRLDFDTQAAGLWNGGLFHVNGVNTHGGSPSSDLLGDMQVVSNIDAGKHTYFQELWFKQILGKVEFTVGLQDLNIEFANSEYGALFLNSSFGILPVISTNMSVPIFPLTTLGITSKWNISPQIAWLNAIYDGSPTDFDYNPYNLEWHLGSKDGVFAISELQYQVNSEALSGTYKIGIYSHNHIEENCFGEKMPDSSNNDIIGLYAYADQKVWEQGNKNLGLFTQLGYSPSKASANNYYLGLGLNYAGLFNKHGKDVLGFAVAHQHFTVDVSSETAIELTYQYALTKNLFIQPDIQYIVNPAGTGETLDNCLACNLRFGLTF